MISLPSPLENEIMKRTSLLLISALILLASCVPQAMLVRTEMRGASPSGLNLSRKTMGVVYLYGNDSRDSSFNRAFASGFASKLEDDYFGGNEEVDLFSMPYVQGADYSAKDSLINLAMDTDKDVIFLVDKPSFGDVSTGPAIRNSSARNISSDSSYIHDVSVPFSTRVFVYDTQNKEDKVFGFAGDRKLNIVVFSNGNASQEAISSSAWKNIAPAAESAGSAAAKSFISTWVEESFIVIYYDGAESGWVNGAEHAYSYKWKEAIDDWIPLLKSKDKEKRSCAAYNIGLACFMLGQPQLALEWLDRSDSEEPINLTNSLREKIEQYTGVK